MFFDFHVHGDQELVRGLEKLGYRGVALVCYSGEYEEHSHLMDSLKNFSDIPDFRIQIGVEIQAKNPQDLKKKVQRFRKKADVILVHGGDVKINRAATEDPRVDILCHAYRNRWDSGINHVLAAKAAENRVAMEINLKYLLMNRPNQRNRILSQFRQIVKLQRKFKFPVIITSDARSLYDIRDPRDLVALSTCFGMTREEAIHALSTVPQEIMERDRVRDQVIVSGARLVE
jgi:ribonuclease P/MRP protein subunit RPP1